MPLPFPPAHRLGQINYLPRTLSGVFAFLVAAALAMERELGGWTYFLAILTFLAYPHLAYLHARIAVDSKRAELNNLVADSILMGLWSAHLHFALLPTLGALAAISLNNAACGGTRRFLWGLAYFGGAALVWGAFSGYQPQTATGPFVTALCSVGILVYIATIGNVLYRQNKNLVRVRNVLRKSEEQFRFIAEHAGDLVSVLDPNGRFRYASRSFGERFEPGAYEEGKDWLELVHPEDRKGAGEFLNRLLASLRAERIQLRMISSGGSPRVVECEGNPVVENGGAMQMIVLVCRDLTARAHAEIDMRLAERAFDRLRDAVLISDDAGQIEFVNKAYSRLTGHAPADLVGRSANEFMGGVQSESVLRTIRDSVERDGHWRGGLAGHTKDGASVPLSARVTAIRDKSGVAAHYVWIIGDEAGARSSHAA